MSQHLPWRGLGLSSNASAADRPHPYRLLDQNPGLFDYVEYSAPLSLEQAGNEASLWPLMMERRPQVPLLFHPVHLNLYGPELEPPDRLQQLAEHLTFVGSAWVGNDLAWWHHRGQPFPGYLYLPPPLDASGLADCAAHVQTVQAAVGVPLLIENPVVIACDGPLHVLDFVAELHHRTGAPLLLDLGHLLGHQLARGLPLDSGLDGFPLDKVVEIHIAGGQVSERGERRFYLDDHSQPVREELFELLESVLPRCTGLRAVTFEADGHPEAIARQTLLRLRRWVPRRGQNRQSLTPPSQIPPPGQTPAPGKAPLDAVSAALPSGRAWALFDRSYGAHTHSDDPVGAEVDRGYRLAVLAEQLDRRWPLCRLLFLGTPSSLGNFSASPAFRSAVEEGETLDDAFRGHLRARLRERRDEVLASVVAFETWLQKGPAAGREAAPGELRLGPGISLGSFPLDLSELVFAVRASKRHLTARLWGTGLLDSSPEEALRQVAARAPPGPWKLAARRLGDSVQLLELEPPALALLERVAAGDNETALTERWGLAVVEQAIAAGLVSRARAL